jgi:hypothetical protein
LRVIQPCATVTGRVDCISVEPDGDSHLRLRVDPEYVGLLARANVEQTCAQNRGPHLVVEILPQHCGVPQRNAQDNCADRGGFTTPAYPKVGAHVSVTGPLVADREHHDWVEIHPAWLIEAT